MHTIIQVILKNGYRDNKGFTLVELIIVIAILGILATIVIPSFVGYLETAKIEVCNISCLQLEKMYHAHLVMEGITHSEEIFYEYLQEYGEQVCPNHGTISYAHESVKCNIHKHEEQDSEDEDVPYL